MSDKKLRHELILCAEKLLFLLQIYDSEKEGNPFADQISHLRSGIDLILFPKDKNESDN